MANLIHNCQQVLCFSVVIHLAALSPLLHCTAFGQTVDVEFSDKTESLGLLIHNGAACWADIDNDGWVDICAGGVWRNNQGAGFTKIADADACVAADFDNDGFVDLFSWASLKLLRNNNGDGFTEFELPALPKTVSRGACWGDFNGDGFVDLFIGGYEQWEANITWPFVVLINEQGKAFRVARTEVGNRARGVTACDFDQDGDLDVYVSNYRLQPNALWVNDGKGKLSNKAPDRGAVATSAGFAGGHSIGASWGDFDNDGLFDLFAGNFAHVDQRGDQPKSRFLGNLGADQNYNFEDLGPCGVPYQESYASPGVGDYDNDGNVDLFFTTVYGVASFGRKNHPMLFRGDGSFSFKDVTLAAKLAELPPTYQAAWADFDNDGDLDLLTAGKLFQNQASERNWLRVALEGDGEVVNRSAVGTQVRVKVGDKTLIRQVEAGTGEGNQNELTLHFGLGHHHDPVSIDILWPNKSQKTLRNITTDQTIKVQFDGAP